MKGWWVIRFPLIDKQPEHRGASSVDVPVPADVAPSETQALAWAYGFVAGKGWFTDYREARVERRPGDRPAAAKTAD